MASLIDIPDECRTFLRGARRRRVLALTYEFSPAIFERTFGFLLGGTAQVDVLHGTTGIPGRPGYRTWKANWPFTFHPKLLVLVGDDRVAVSLGSANLSSGGLQENLEAFGYFGPGNGDVHAGVRRFLEKLRAKEVLPQDLDLSEILGLLPDAASKPTPVISTLDGRLVDSVLQRLTSRKERVERIDILSPMYGRFDPVVGELRRRLGLPKVTIRTFAPGGMPPVTGVTETRTLEAPEEGRVMAEAHAKMYAFIRGDRADVFWGSANASPSAWLRFAPQRAANIELLVHSRVSSRVWQQMRDHLPEDHKWRPVPFNAEADVPEGSEREGGWQLLHGTWDGSELKVDASADATRRIKLRSGKGVTVEFRISPEGRQFLVPPALARRLGYRAGEEARPEIQWVDDGGHWHPLPVNMVDVIGGESSGGVLDSLFQQYLGRSPPWVPWGGRVRVKTSKGTKEDEEIEALAHEPALDRLVGAWRAVARGISQSSGGAGTALHRARVEEILKVVGRDAQRHPAVWPRARRTFVEEALWRG